MVFLWGANPRDNHPIFFHHVLKGVRNGARLYVVDPRRTPTAQWADVWLGLNVGTDVALANAMAREIIHARLANDAFGFPMSDGSETNVLAMGLFTVKSRPDPKNHRRSRLIGPPRVASAS